MNKVYYKVLQNNLASAYVGSPFFVHNGGSSLQIIYQVNKWVKPKMPGTKLMVFENLIDAKEFKNKWGDRIFRCEVTNPTKKGIMVSTPAVGLIQRLKKILNLRKQKKKFMNYVDEPIHGTIFCDSVKLISEII